MKFPNLTVGVPSLALRSERNPSEAENIIRVLPRAYTHGFREGG